MIIGNPDRFGFEILSDDLTSELVDMFIVVSGHRVSGRNPVYAPTFVGEMKRFMKRHASSPPIEFDFGSRSDDEAFALLHEVSSQGEAIKNLTPSAVDSYYRMHSIDDAVDDWEIYVFDVADEKHIVCREIPIDNCVDAGTSKIWHSAVSRNDFIQTLEEFVKLFPS